MITVLKKGMLTTVQDLGRAGFQRYGMPSSGAMDEYSLRLANILTGNPQEEAVLEFTFAGPTLRFETDVIFAVTGGRFDLRLNGEPVPMNTAVQACAGDELVTGMAEAGMRGYIAFAGGLDLPLVMGSRSTGLKAKIGGLDGRALQAGDTLALRETCASLPNMEKRTAPAALLRKFPETLTVHFTLGPQDDLFSTEGKRTFQAGRYLLSQQSDRMGFRLEGPAVEKAEGTDGNIISDGICFGAIQVTNGQPIVMMADRQTTGGYPKIGCVIRADLPDLAQRRPGDAIRFRAISPAGAQQQYIRYLKALDKLAAKLNRQAAVIDSGFTLRAGERICRVSIEEIQ